MSAAEEHDPCRCCDEPIVTVFEDDDGDEYCSPECVAEHRQCEADEADEESAYQARVGR